MSKKIKVVVLEPGKEARIAEIDNSLESMQSFVGGYIEPFYPVAEEDVCIIVNEEGKINGMELNRAVRVNYILEEMDYPSLRESFRMAETYGEHVEGLITFTEDSFPVPYKRHERTYAVSSDNKAYQLGKDGYSIFGNSLDGKDVGVRLDMYMAEEKGGKDGWQVDLCCLKHPCDDILDIIAGPCFICDCTGDSFDSLTDEQCQRYLEKFRYPEQFSYSARGISAVPYHPESNESTKQPIN